MRERQLTGGTINCRSLSRSGAERDPSILSDAAFERFFHRSRATQALIDVGAIMMGFVLAGATGIAIAASFFFLIFC